MFGTYPFLHQKVINFVIKILINYIKYSMRKKSKEYNSTNDITVNGPVNVVRLTGNIRGVEKVIYLFMDIHLDPGNQQECENLRSSDIKNYFLNNFDNSNNSDKTYDFLLLMVIWLLT
jgi:hypothetical protein